MKSTSASWVVAEALPSAMTIATALSLIATSDAALAAPTGDGTASGSMTVAGKTTPLKYAYARAQKGFFDKTKEDVRVILSDVPIPEEALKDEFARHHLAEAGKLHAVEVVLDADRQPIGGGLLHEAWMKTGGYVSVSGMHVFTPKTFDGKVAEGTLATRKPDEFMNKTFEYKASFSVSVWRKPAPTASGAAAASSAPGKAAIAFMKAARSSDKAALKKSMNAEAGKQLDGPNGKEMLEMLKMMTPDPAPAKIESVDMKGGMAEVTVVEGGKDGNVTSTLHFVLDGGQWKVAGSHG
jgi:hypothetical protein